MPHRQIPVVPGADYTAKVMCFPTWHLEAVRSRAARLALADRWLDIDISLDAFEEWPHGYPTVVKWALQASTRETGSFLIEKGKRDARAWVVAAGLEPLLAAGGGAGGGRPLVDGRGAVVGSAAAAPRPPAAGGLVDAHGDALGHADGGGGGGGHEGGGGHAAGHKRHREEPARQPAAAAAPAVPGLSGQPRSDDAPLGKQAPRGAG